MSFFRLSGCAATILALCVALPATTQSQSLSAQESDPNVMGWMQGFPAARRQNHHAAGFDLFSVFRVCVGRYAIFANSCLPKRSVAALAHTNPLNYVSSQDFDLAQVEIDALTFTPMNSDATMTWEESLFANYTDGMLILHKRAGRL